MLSQRHFFGKSNIQYQNEMDFDKNNFTGKSQKTTLNIGLKDKYAYHVEGKLANQYKIFKVKCHTKYLIYL